MRMCSLRSREMVWEYIRWEWSAAGLGPWWNRLLYFSCIIVLEYIRWE